ncbi:YjjG family noncanonical pyrimidine nucleotidase [Bacteroides sedimenti]|uniref:Noncanonical pyrimidine nucleotidase, YjjG family protein n=1 Tax=Bacteroides sedimenti TaxID=2136147 RepID=A0ABN6ZD40_9BACE
MYTNIFFDLDDTLWNFSENAYDSFAEVYANFNFDRYFDSFDGFYTIYKEYNAALWIEYGNGEISKEELNRRRFCHPLESVGVYDEALAKSYSDDFFRLIPTKSKLLPYAKETLEYLSGRYRLFILSNGFRELQFQKMKSAGIEHYFEKVILSEDIRVHKPHPEIFHFALSATQSLLNESLMIGDSWEADILGAKGVNMDQVFLNPSNRPFSSFKPTYHIQNLKEVLGIL